MNPPLRILILNFRDLSHPGAGGAEVFTEEIGKRLVKYGHQLTIFTSAFDGCETESYRSGMRIVRTGGKYSVYGKGRQFVKRYHGDFDVIVDEINTIPFQISRAARETPVVALIHQLAREVWFHETWAPLSLLGYFALERFWLRKYRDNPTVTVSESTRDDLMNIGFKQVHIVRNGVGTQPLQKLPSKPDHPILIFIGRIVSSKNPDHCLRAFAEIKHQFPQAELWVLGDGYQRSKLERRHVEGVSFLGHVTETEKFERLRKAHVLMVPSVREGWGCTVIESNAMGTPAVGYNVPGLRDSIVDGKTGILVDPDPHHLAQAVVDLLRDGSLRDSLAENALEWSRRFSWDDSAARFDSVLESVVEQRS